MKAFNAAPQWTYTSNSCGYMLFKDGVPQGGAGTTDRNYAPRKRHWRHIRADVQMFKESAERQCAEKNRSNA